MTKRPSGPRRGRPRVSEREAEPRVPPIDRPQQAAGRRLTAVEALAGFEGPPGEFLKRLIVFQGRLVGADHGVVIRFSTQGGPVVVADYNPQHDRLPPPWVRLAAEQAARVFAASGPVVLALKPVPTPRFEPGGDRAVAPSLAAAGGGALELVLMGLPQTWGLDGGRYMVAMAIEGGDKAAVDHAAQQVELTLGLLSAYDARCQTRQHRGGIDRLTESVDVLAAVAGCRRFREAAMALCNELASRHGAHRVSLGWVHGRSTVKVAAMSRTERVNRRMKLVQDLEAAMDECHDQDVEVVSPAPPQVPVVSRDHRAMVQAHGSTSLMSLPLRHGQEVVAILTVEWDQPPPPPPEAPEGSPPDGSRLGSAGEPADPERAPTSPAGAPTRLRMVAELATPLLVQLHHRDRWAGAKAKDSSGRLFGMAVGTEHTWVKLAAVGLLAGVLWLVLGTGTDHVKSSFVVEAVQRQLVTAPFAGYLEAVHVGPGDAVEADGTVLAELDTSELRLEAAELRAQEVAYRKRAEVARGESDMGEVQAASAEAAAVAARRELVELQIAQASLRSPLGGLVMSGDLTKQLGKPVQEGETLFEVAPVERLRAELFVPEDRAGEVAPGMAGELATTTYPDQRVGFVVRHVEPLARVEGGRNVFVAEVELDHQPAWLRPGMTGAARLDAGEASHLWLWTRDAVNWLRMKLWL